MIDLQVLGLFIVAALALLLTPGPAVLFVVNRSVQHGRFSGLVAALGLSVGGLIHVAAAVVGLSAILMTSALAFSVVKYAGAAYLIYLGVRAVFSSGGGEEDRANGRPTLRRAFLDGVLVNTLNPKAALFFLAFLPQFANPARGPVSPQLLALGLVFVSLGLVTDGLYVLAAGTVGTWLRSRPGIASGSRWLVGSTYIGLGLVAALTDRSS